MSRQKVENKNMERAEVNKVVTIKCSLRQNSGPEGLGSVQPWIKDIDCGRFDNEYCSSIQNQKRNFRRDHYGFFSSFQCRSF